MKSSTAHGERMVILKIHVACMQEGAEEPGWVGM
jgi:hypothetical protein